MNQEQVMSLVRTILSIAGTMLVSRGVFSAADWTSVMGAMMMVAPVVWSMVDKTKASMIAKVDAMPEVSGVITKNNIAGHDLAMTVTSPTVQAAGSTAAASIAK